MNFFNDLMGKKGSTPTQNAKPNNTNNPSPYSNSQPNTTTTSTNGNSSKTSSSSSKQSNLNPDQIREIVKQESERRMIGFRKQLADVKNQRDTLQLELNRTKAELQGTKTVQQMRGQDSMNTTTTTTNNTNQDFEIANRLREQLEESNTRCAISESEKMSLQQQITSITASLEQQKSKAQAFEAMEADLQSQFTSTMVTHKKEMQDLETKLTRAKAKASNESTQLQSKKLQEQMELDMKTRASSEHAAQLLIAKLNQEQKELKEQIALGVQHVEKLKKEHVDTSKQDFEKIQVLTQQMNQMEKDVVLNQAENKRTMEAAQQKLETTVVARERKIWEEARQELIVQLDNFKNTNVQEAEEKKNMVLKLNQVQKEFNEFKEATVQAATATKQLEDQTKTLEMELKTANANLVTLTKSSKVQSENLTAAQNEKKKMIELHVKEIKQIHIETQRKVEAAAAAATLRASEETENEKTQEMASQLQTSREQLATAETERDTAVAESNLKMIENKELLKKINDMTKNHNAILKNMKEIDNKQKEKFADDIQQKEVLERKQQQKEQEHTNALLAMAKEHAKKEQENRSNYTTLEKKSNQDTIEMKKMKTQIQQLKKSLKDTQEKVLQVNVTNEKKTKIMEGTIVQLKAEISAKNEKEKMTNAAAAIAATSATNAAATATASAASASATVIKIEKEKKELVMQLQELSSSRLLLEQKLQETSTQHATVVSTLKQTTTKHTEMLDKYTFKNEENIENLAKIKTLKQKLETVENQLNSFQSENARAVADAADDNDQKMNDLRQELTVVKVDLENARGSTSRAESALREALEGSADELEIRMKQNKDEHERTIQSLKNGFTREKEAEMNEKEESWRSQTDMLLRTTMEKAREEWKAAKAKELEKSLAFWRNTWDIEKDRAIQEKIISEKKLWNQSMSIRTDARVLAAQQEWDTQTEKREIEMRSRLENQHGIATEGLLAKHEAELNAISSAYEVARELQKETSKSLKDSENNLNVYKKNMEIKMKKNGAASLSKLVEVRKELIQIKASMMALRREASAFQRPAPQMQALAEVMHKWYTDEEWNEHDGTHDPSPNCSLDDPMISHLMESWTTDKGKLKLLRTWLKQILSNKKIKQTKSFRPGVELTKLSPEVCEGFLRIVVPMLRSRDDIEVSAYHRTKRETWRELRLRVAPSGQMPPFVGGGTPIGVAQQRTRALQSRSVGANATPTSSMLGLRNNSNNSNNSNNGKNESGSGRHGNQRSQSDYLTTRTPPVPLLQPAPQQPSSSNRSNRRTSGSRVRRHSSVDLGTPTWGNGGTTTEDTSSNTTPMSDVESSPWMKTPSTGTDQQNYGQSGGGTNSSMNSGSSSNGSSNGRQIRRGSFAGRESPRHSEMNNQSQQGRPTQASRRLNLTKINNRLSKLRDVN